MKNDLAPDPSAAIRIWRTVKWLVASAAIAAVTLLAGVGLAAVLGRSGTDGTWNRWSAVGQTFGALSSVIAGLALGALVFTFSIQFQELRMQRSELALQRESLNRSQGELFRSAEASIRALHVDLLKMAVDDERLASVWPPLEPGLPHDRNRQYLYANLILQHHLLCLRMGDYTESQIESHLRYLFVSPLIRKYWRAAGAARAFLVPGTDEFLFTQMADAICTEYEGVLATAATVEEDLAARPSVGQGIQWEQLDRESAA